ncbi:MAG: biotin carboxylase [Deltaproteobacteria bacterium HGW-Deltaproteobacteria-14]|nr:MAG: biotin carboxylase [Deltaproteobacteria bacterium HGW-Deltaproteobacteria-14]
MGQDCYDHNPLVHRDRRLGGAKSAWVRSFACEDVRPLIVCRGPIRKEAIDVFREMGIEHCGMLLSEKDSIVYTQALAPELRFMGPEHVHRVSDYSGATRAERMERIGQIIGVCREHGYSHVFAGYGFMAEDETFVSAIEDAGLVFIGPGSHVVRAAGAKDEAKRTALAEQVSVTPGINDLTTRALLKRHTSAAALAALVRERGLGVDTAAWTEDMALEDLAGAVLDAAHAKGVDVYTVDELTAVAAEAVARMLEELPGRRIRLKAIGGGGGKGQRIVTAATEAPDKLREILSEVKATGAGDNKNVIVELNIEETRHVEIQLIGNGSWSISLGARDCSLQMHEQKLLEISLTQEATSAAIAAAQQDGRELEARALERELAMLEEMEAQAERFGTAVRLDNASTFECIVDQGRHYFMEVNTRIQVEHRVSELCYALRFEAPDDPRDVFEVTSLVEMMVLLARHGARLPRPTRVRREGAAIEARLNATDRALQPHAGGIIQNWSDPAPGEVRDDQGICTKNPDTQSFIHYKLAGAYDSNIALLVTVGDDRLESLTRLVDTLRQMKISGVDLETNLTFHYGLAHWLLGRNAHAMPSTRFVVPYLTQVGLLKRHARDLDAMYAWSQLRAGCELRFASRPPALKAIRRALTLKETLLARVLDVAFRDPHVMSAWLSAHRHDFAFGEDERLVWLTNPLRLLKSSYRLMNMEWDPRRAPAHVIWEHDNVVLERGLGFYDRLEERLGRPSWADLQARLADATPPSGFDAALWGETRAAHLGFQAGLDLLALIPIIGQRARFYELDVNADLSVTIPERLLDPTLQAEMRRVLAPPPATSDDTIVAVTGGMYYSQEAPDRPPLIREGDHFEVGQPLYVIEVMKMYNKIPAPFSGTIDEALIDADGTIVKKGQPLFRITPDVRLEREDPAERKRRRKKSTDLALHSFPASPRG